MTPSDSTRPRSTARFLFEGRNDTRSQKLKYAVVVSVTAKRMPDLYDRVVRRYHTQLEALRPVIEIPVRIDTDDAEGSS
jgi:hypothetical protein